MFAYLPLCFSALSLLAVLLLAVRREVREDGMTPAQRLKKAEAQLSNHDQLHTGQQQARERLAETIMAEIKRVETDADRRCKALERDTEKVNRLQLDMATMQEQLKRLPGMEHKIDNLTALLTRVLADKINP